MDYIKINKSLKVGGYAIADNQVKSPVKILRLGKIFAKVMDCQTGYEWELMANRLQPISPSKTVFVFDGEELELTEEQTNDQR